MKKYIIILLVAVCTSAVAQNLNLNNFIKSNNQQLIEDAIKEGFYVVESSYYLQDENGKSFGRNGQAYFNKQTYVGIALDGYLVLPDAAYTPWIGDNDYERYAEKYKAVLNDISYHRINEENKKMADSASVGDTTMIFNNIRLMKDSVMQGFVLDTTKGEKEGWIVLINRNEKTYNLQSIRRSITVDTAKSVQVELPSDITSVVGGIYVVPNVNRVGVITFKLLGIVQPVEGGKIVTINTPFAGFVVPCQHKCDLSQLEQIDCGNKDADEQKVNDKDKKKESKCKRDKKKDKDKNKK